MKTVQSIVIAASIILASASAVAGPSQSIGGQIDRVGSNTLVVSAAPTKQAAYQAGLARLTQLKAASPQQLSQALNVNSSTINGTTLHLKAGGYVTVQERMDAAGSITFVSAVSVGFHYLETDSDK